MMDEPKRLTLTIEGEFTAFELAALYSFIRGLDRDARHWKVFVEDPSGTTLREAMVMLRKMMPDVPGRHTEFAAFRKQ